MQLIKKIKRKNCFLILLLIYSLNFYGKCNDLIASFNASETIICGPGSKHVTFNNTSTGSNAGTAAYNWYLNGVPFSSTTGLTAPKQATISDVGTYTVMLVGTSNNCKDTAYVTIYIRPFPIANFTASENDCEGTTITFKNLSSGTGSFTSYSWDFGDGTKATQPDPKHTYPTVKQYIVSFTISNGSNCSNTYKDTVTTSSGPTVNITGKDADGDTRYCLALNDTLTRDTVKFYNSSVGAQSYRWDFGDGSELYTTSSKEMMTHIYTHYGTFKVTMIAVSAGGCEKAVELTIVFNKSVESTFTLTAAELSGCTSHSVTPVNTSKNADSYSWNFGDGTPAVSVSNMTPFTHLYKKKGKYLLSLKATNTCNSDSFQSDTIRVESQPLSKFDLTPLSGCTPQTVTFVNNTESSSINSYHWNFGDGTEWNGAGNPAPKVYTEGKWKVLLVTTNSCGNDSATQSLTILPLPIAPSANEQTICSGNTAKLSITSPQGTYEWYDAELNGTLIGSGHTFTTPVLFSTTTFYVQCKVGNCVSKRSAVKVNVLPLPTISPISDIIICKGNHAELMIKQPGSCEWFDAASGGNLLDTTHQFTTPSLFTSTTYFVQLTSENCSSERMPIHVLVKDPPRASYKTDTVCVGEQTTFMDASTNNPSKWHWDFGDGTANENAPTVKHAYLNAGTYITSLIVSNGIGCGDTLFQKAIVNSLIDVDFSVKDSACPLELLLFKEGSATGNDSIAFSTWNFGDGSLTSAALDATHLYQNSGTFTITHRVTSVKGCHSSISKSVYIAPSPVADFSFLNTCQIQESIFMDRSTQNPASWLWDFGDLQKSGLKNPRHIYAKSGYYTISLLVKTSIGCVDTVSHRVFVYPQPIAKFTADTVCWGDTTSFSNASLAVDGTVDKIFWDFDDGSTSAEFQPKHVFITQKDNFNVALSIVTSHGCRDTISQQVKIKPIPAFRFFATEREGCEEFQTAFYDSSSVSGGKITKWLWDFGDGNLSYRRYPLHTFSDAGNYFVTLQITSSYGCEISRKLDYPIVVHPKPTAAFLATPTEVGIEQPTVQFMDVSSEAILWDWDFGDHKTSIEQNPFHTYTQVGKFTVTQIAISEYGCTDTVSHTVQVNPQPTIYIPNAFSPDGNNVNDIFVPVGDGIETFEMHIYDRFGTEIFKTNDISNGWNGRVDGTKERVHEGVYVYKIIIKDALELIHRYVGSVFVSGQ
ncbi:MAG TPA: PKD domain-containing protein [Bacteroidia bacterium]|nr:PKD domain-containing protein [Bacteroidia bacterium]